MPFPAMPEVNPGAAQETCLPETDMPIWPTRPGTARRVFCQVPGSAVQVTEINAPTACLLRHPE
jgi:hypothetical protein